MERILVACDGSPDSVAALRVARSLADRTGATVRVVTAVEPLPVFDTGFMVALPESDMQESRRQEVEDRVQEALAEAGADDWPLEILPGAPVATIAQRAAAWEADLVVAGRGSHGPLDRIFGTETVLQLLHLASVPVLAVPPSSREAPRRPLVALDLSDFGLRAAALALAVVGPEAPVTIVHVLPGTDHLSGDDDQVTGRMEEDARAGLLSQIRELGLSMDRVELHVRSGRAADEIVDVAEEVGADLIVAGSHGHSFMGRLLLGSVSTRLVRHGGRAVLVAPGPGPEAEDRAEAVEVDDATDRTPHPWCELLDGFTRRHAGRRASLDLQARSWGARQTGSNFPLRGVDYDPRDDRVDIVLGEEGAGASHLTHRVAHPERVHVVRDAQDREVGLRIETDRTVVTLGIQPPPSPDEAA
jgi:nucleotide-binding universal stress UspA family protein